MSSFPIEADRLRTFATDVLRFADVPEADARLVADTLVQADLWGHQSHGIMRLSWYFARLKTGVMHAQTAPELVIDAGALAMLDGHDGIGQVLAARATQEAIARAKTHGIGAVGVRNSNHFGTAMYFTRMAALEGCVGFLTTNASPAMAPWGGLRKTVGTNPWSIASPGGSHTRMMLDIANTAVARGKIYIAKKKGQQIPPGWAMNTEGVATTDPTEAIAGLIMPMAGHKGYAISVMMDMLSGVLTGSAFGSGVNGPYVTDKKSGCGHFMIALNIAAFQPLAEFNTRIDTLICELKSVPLAEGTEEIFYPGEIEAKTELQNLRDGIVLPDDTLADLHRLANEIGVATI